MKYDVGIHLIDGDFLRVTLDGIERGMFLNVLDRPGVSWVIVPDGDGSECIIRRDRIKYVRITALYE